MGNYVGYCEKCFGPDESLPKRQSIKAIINDSPTKKGSLKQEVPEYMKLYNIQADEETKQNAQNNLEIEVVDKGLMDLKRYTVISRTEDIKSNKSSTSSKNSGKRSITMQGLDASFDDDELDNIEHNFKKPKGQGSKINTQNKTQPETEQDNPDVILSGKVVITHSEAN